MAAYKKKYRDLAMQIICDFYAEHELGSEIDTRCLYAHGFPKTMDAEHLCSVLEGMGYLSVTRFYGHPSRIKLTDNGKCYFERKADLSAEKRAEWIRYIITTMIAVVALVVSIISIALQFRPPQ